MVMMMGTRRSVYLNDQEDSSFYPEDVSFMATDSLLLASRRTDGQGTGYQLFLYNFMDRNNRSAYSNCFGPSAAFALPPGTRGVTLAQTSNDVISVTADSIYLWKVEHAGGQYLLREVCSDSTPAPIREIRLSERDARALVFDDKGGAYRYFLSNNTSLRIWRLYDGNYISDNDRITIEPLCIGPQGGVLAYLKGEDGVNLKEPPYVGFRLALMEKRSHISAETHGGVTSVQVEDLSSEGAVRTYLYSGGDGRVVTPNGISTVLSSSYYVSYTNDFLCERISEGVTRWYSGPCLFDARSGDHLMHLALKEDRKPDNCRYEDAFLEGDQLAAVFRRADGRKILRFYSISGKSFVKERTLKDNCQFFGWMSDGYFLYESGDTLYRDHPKATLRAQVLCDSFDGMLGPNSPDYFRFFKRSDGGVYWFSTSDGKVRETKMGLHFSPDGGVFTRIGDNHPTTFSIIDSRTLDTLHTRNVEGWGGFEKFSRDSRKFLCSEDGRQVTCLDVPSGRNLWKVDIWAPISCVAGSKYAVLQSNSLFVLDLSDGSVVCEFETNPEKRSELMLSPDEHWLLADRKLYSLRTRELISADVDDGYTSLEDEYILYPKRIMRLPNEKNLFNNTEKMK